MVASKATKDPQPDTFKEEGSSRGARKFEKKVQFYTKVKDTVASLNASKAIGKKKTHRRNRQKQLKAYNLSALLEGLPELRESWQLPATTKKLSSKSRQKLIETEGKQLLAVINHPNYQSNPLAAIQRHLESTQPVIVEEPKKKTKKTGKKSKASSDAQAMDI
ncbi:hypothetical protein GIB67_023483 [Kingdonia uniflora]|uniref:Ribosome biogenesis protein slx9-like n=1 Tax=Kingdonia uniflora TaxID=39325 RepID=A0A7J7PA84_9MAGN|nr:hypothetical protein GIB67_023483 [Kingdonia uniflora]